MNEKMKINQRIDLLLKDKDGNIKLHKTVDFRNGVKTEKEVLD